MDWDLLDLGSLTSLRCPGCAAALAGGLMRPVEWSEMRCVIVITCPQCGTDSMSVLDVRGATGPDPIDVDDVITAHDILARRDWQVGELFAA